MTEQQGFNGVALADRAIRHLGIEVANAQISLATQNARLEEVAEAASHINFDLWEESGGAITTTSHEGGSPPPTQLTTRWTVPGYQVEAVMRLLAALQPR